MPFRIREGSKKGLIHQKCKALRLTFRRLGQMYQSIILKVRKCRQRLFSGLRVMADKLSMVLVGEKKLETFIFEFELDGLNNCMKNQI